MTIPCRCSCAVIDFPNGRHNGHAGACIVQYADDTQVLVSGRKTDLRPTIARLEITLDALSAWFSANGLKVSAEQTQLMVVARTTGPARHWRHGQRLDIATM